jgi:hypothetical protein
MRARPKAVAIVSWFLVVAGGISVISSLAMMNNEVAREVMSQNKLPVPVQYAMQVAGVLVMIVCGLSMLRGKAWARTTYVAWSAVGIVIAFATSPFTATLIPGVVFFLVVTFLLYRPASNAFFRGVGPAAGESSAVNV